MHTNTYLIEKVLHGHLAVTILVTLTATLSMVINGLIIGQLLGSDALVAFGLTSPVFLLLGAVSGIFSNGGAIKCANHIGRGDMTAVQLNFTATTLSSISVGAVYMLFCLLLADPLSNLFGAGDNIEGMAAGYIRGLGISAIPFLLLQNLLIYLRMDSNQRISLISMIVVIVANTVVALFCASSTNLGLFGIGASIMVGNLAGLFIAMTHFKRRERMLRFCSPSGSRTVLKDICMAGLPTAINRGSQTIKNLVLNVFLLSLGGSAAVLALSVQTNVYQFLIAISTGYGLMVATMCGIFFGERDRRAITDTLRVALKSGITLSTIVAVLLFIFAKPVAGMFIADGGDLDLAARCLRLFAISQPTSTVCLIFLYMYQTMGNLLMSNVISLSRGALYVILVSFTLAPLIGLDGVWISFFLADVLSVLTIMLFIWTKSGKFPRHMEDFVVAKSSVFDIDTVCELSITNKMEEVSGLVGKISEMCVEHNIPQDRADRIALCIEEMAGNVVEHAFNDEKDHSIDIRIVKEGDDVIFRMRDDGVRFNPIVADTDGHLGIKVVHAAAKNIEYSYSLKLNNLTVTV